MKGLSLVELMIAIALSLLLTLGIIQLFQGSKVTFNTNEALARMQENGRFTLEILKRELRETGTHGWCAGRVTITDHTNSCDEFPNGGNSPLMGWEFASTSDGDSYNMPADLDPANIPAGSWSTATGTGLHQNLNGQLVPGSDFFVVRRFEPLQYTINSNSSNDRIALTAGFPITGDITLVTNCSFADLFQQASAGGDLDKSSFACSATGPGNQTALPWSTQYGVGAQVFRVQEIAYFVGFDPTRGDGVPGLYRLNLSNGIREELVEGVENLQVRYGYSRDATQGGDGQSVRFEEDWLTADQVPNWRQVIAMRISMSVQSPDIADGERDAQTFTLAGVDVTSAADGRLRQPFSTTIALRNQIIVP
ncbi:MAG: PilW family protein [Pseudomonadota bacterium]